MKTIYIDVYFLINFTVDALALYFSLAFSKIKSSVPRLLVSAFIGAQYAVLGIMFLENTVLMYPLSFAFFTVMIIIVTWGIGLYRKIKYAISFLLFQIIIGGLVYYGYCLLDKYIKLDFLKSTQGENKNLLILSVIILLAIGVLKLIIALFSNTKSEICVKLEIKYNKRISELEAFVDSGNMAKDPFDNTPVMLVSDEKLCDIFGVDINAGENFEGLDYSIKKKIRIIPVGFGGNNRVLYALRPDEAYVYKGKQKEKISILIAADREGVSYCGYPALMPLSAIEDIL